MNPFDRLKANAVETCRGEGSHYTSRLDLRHFGLSSMLFLQNKCNGDHKLKILDAGRMPFLNMLLEINRVFEIDPMQVQIMRLDLAIDVQGYSVEWFNQNVRVAHKRYTTQIEQRVRECKQVQTLYFGQRPNFFRIYDKAAHRRMEYRKALRRWSQDHSIPTFEECYGHSQDQIVTRVERQYAGRGVPQIIRTMGQFQTNAAGFNPFEPLDYSEIDFSEDSINSLQGEWYVKAQGIFRLIERYGYHEARSRLDAKTGRNTSRLFQQLAMAMDGDGNSQPPNLFEMYKSSIELQG